MVNFKIQFQYQGKNYTGAVRKILDPVQFLVSSVTPDDLPLPDPYVFSWNKIDKQLHFGTDPKHLELGGEIARVIFEECERSSIPYNE